MQPTGMATGRLKNQAKIRINNWAVKTLRNIVTG
ncbi:MAG: hypothetical protein BWY72_02296 [Bacteroidetes bacterium ADurb.Bin416]|nr:MAG: hypothetical protein BWY72_02296 [Bacteroidetes bacterium ADurb.Bin416]